MKTTKIVVGSGSEALPLMKEAMDLRLCYAYGEAAVLFQAFLNDKPYVPYHNFGKTVKRGAKPKHLRMACLYENGEMIAWTIQWLDVRYSITDEFWRFTRIDCRNKGHQRILVRTLKLL